MGKGEGCAWSIGRNLWGDLKVIRVVVEMNVFLLKRERRGRADGGGEGGRALHVVLPLKGAIQRE